MASFNRIILLGNLTRDPQLSYTASNVAVCKFGLATNHRWRDKDGNQREETCFVDCTVFGRGGETFNQYMSKGRSVLVEGRLQLNQWTTPEGDKRSKHEVLVDNFTFVGGQGNESRGPENRGSERRGQPAPVGGRSQDSGPGYDEPPPPSDDDIPF
ncbi:MAG: single-stranded DNA-binding protein [Phycisphaerae bacterium]|nr:single-stranded DNA-binding protein [Phycisphaerae bacterium]